ncbi:MAG: chemotaxis protein CheD [Verrucomicrobiota bacterium]|nr:chemotaxis protein CheD [Verrucomicrobiota bacterium]
MITEDKTLRKIYLKPGELFICSEPAQVFTVLGSCVSVTLFSRRLKLAAICHAMLSNPGKQTAEPDEHPEPYKYISLAIPTMINCYQRYGLGAGDIEVKLFGGANIFHHTNSSRNGHGVGSSNVECALQLLRAANLNPMVIQVGGHTGRKLIFNTATGEVLLKNVKATLLSINS